MERLDCSGLPEGPLSHWIQCAKSSLPRGLYLTLFAQLILEAGFWLVCFVAVLYGRILNPLKQVAPVFFPCDGLDTVQRRCGDLPLPWTLQRGKLNKEFLQGMSHLLQCLSPGAGDDISCKKKTPFLGKHMKCRGSQL